MSQRNPAEAWEPWTPEAGKPWGLKWAGHLYRRASFGASWPDLQAAVRDGPEATIGRLLSGAPGHEDFDQLMDALAPESRQGYYSADAATQLQGWWLYRMIFTLHPLEERMTLFWHNHFATSIVKVQQPDLMRQQNALIRQYALGKFRPFLLAMSQDPAMLLWLDSNSNVRSHPNENFAREVMELFTLGTGNYTEKDIREAARAFTGWHTDGTRFVFNKYQHDDGPKTFLGQTGNWDGGDILRIILEQPACARFLVRKLYRHFLSEDEAPPDSLLEPLADQFRRSDYDIGALVGTLLRSRQFFSEAAYRKRIKGPTEYLVGLLRSLEATREGEGQAASGYLALPSQFEGLGQTLFAPPNVKGWDGGKAWLNSATLLARDNLAWRLLQGSPQNTLGARINPLALVQKYADRNDYARQVDFLLDLLLQPDQGEIAGQARQELVDFLARDNPRGVALENRLRETIHAILFMPEYQLA